jgi:hypothetical protein
VSIRLSHSVKNLTSNIVSCDEQVPYLQPDAVREWLEGGCLGVPLQQLSNCA